MKKLVLILTLFFAHPAEAVRYWTAATGGTTGNCASAQGASDPGLYLRTIAAGIACMSASDRLTIKGGTYTERITTAPSGVSGNPTIIEANGTDVVDWRPSSGGNGVLVLDGNFQWITVRGDVGAKNLKLSCTGGSSSDCSPLNIRSSTVASMNIVIEGVDVTGNSGNTIMFLGDPGTGNGGGVTVRDFKMHDGGSLFGSNLEHAIYVVSSGNTVQSAEFYNIGGYAIHNYNGAHPTPPSNNTYDRLLIRNTGNAGATMFAVGLVSGSNNVLKNSILTKNVNALQIVGTSNRALNNSIHGNGVSPSACGSFCYPAVVIDALASTARVSNNAVFANAVNSIDNLGTGTVLETNQTTEPRFADPTNNDFRLCTAAGVPHASCTGASTAIDAGTNLASLGVTTDYAGTSRPQGAAFDIGAYESGAGTCPATPALVAQYSFDNVATDSSGNGNNGTLTAVSYVTGKYSQGASFNGTTSFMSVADATSLFLCTGFTLEGWIKPADTPTTFKAVIYKGQFWSYSATDPGYCTNNGPAGGYVQGGDTHACYGTAFTPDVWSHFAVTYDSTLGSANIKIYKDGVAVTSANGTTVLNRVTDSLFIGKSEFGEFFNGTIDEVRVYNYARSAAQIQTDMLTPINALTTPFLTIGAGSGTFKVGAGATAFKLQGAP